MVYDNTAGPVNYEAAEKGFAIHGGKDDYNYPEYEVYTDDGKGNGDLVCKTMDLWWARRIAQALDEEGSI